MSDPTTIFEQARPRLTGLAYRMLGTMAEAEDAVQDTGLRWLRADHHGISNPDGWLTQVCTNRCLDLLKSANRQRVDYVGPWLPEPLHTTTGSTIEDDMVLADSLSTAFLLMLDRLNPRERAAFLLHDLFGHSHDDVAETLNISTTGSRQLVSRARKHVRTPQRRASIAKDTGLAFLAAFQRALISHDTGELMRMLSQDIELHADGGGKVPAARRVLVGPTKINGFLTKVMLPAWGRQQTELRRINGRAGLVTLDKGSVTAVLTLRFDDAGLPDRMFIMRNPDKLRRIDVAPGYHIDGASLGTDG